MADDIRKSITLSLKLIGTAAGSLSSAAANISKVAVSVDKFSRALSSLPDTSKTISPLEKLSKLALPNVDRFAKGIKALLDIKQVPNLSPFVEELKKLTGLSAPNVKALSDGLRGLIEIKNVSALNAKIASLGQSLFTLKGISLPNLKIITKGLFDLQKINVAPRNAQIVSLSRSLQSLNGITVPNLKNITVGLANLVKLKVAPLNTKLVSLGKALQSFNGIVFPKFTSFTNFLKNIQSFKIPSTASAVAEIKKLANAFASLSKSERVVSSLERIAASAGRVSQTTRDAGNATTFFSTSFSAFGDKIKRYLQYRVIADAVIGLKQAMIDGVGTIIDYDQALKNLQAISRATASQVIQFGDRIREVATYTKFSVTEIAEGMVILAQAGLSPAQVIATIGAAADLATGTLTNLAITVDLLTTAMNVFGIAATKSAHIADVYANAVNGSKLTIDKLRTAMNYVGPIASDAGVKFQELTAALMTLANSGLRASTMGTSLRKIFQEILDPSEKFITAVHKAGLTLENFNFHTQGMTKVLKALRIVLTNAETGFVDVGKSASIFGQRAVSGTVALVKVTKEGVWAYTQMLAKTAMVGSSADMARTQLEGLKTGFKNLADRVGVLAVELGKAGINNVLVAILESSKALVIVLTKLTQSTIARTIVVFGALLVATKAFYVVFAQLTALLVGREFIIAATGIKTFAGAMSLAGAASKVLLTRIIALSAALLTNPWTLLAVAVAAAGAAMYVFLHDSEKTNATLGEMNQKLAETYDNYQKINGELKDYVKKVDEVIQLIISNPLEGEHAHRDLIHELIQMYPQYSREILKAGDSLFLLKKSIKEINDLEKENYLRKSKEEAGQLVKTVFDSRRKLEGLKRTRGELLASIYGFDTDQTRALDKKIHGVELDIRSGMARLALIVHESQLAKEKVNWELVLGKDGAKIVFEYLEKTLKASAQMEEELKKGRSTPKEINVITKQRLTKLEESYKDELAIIENKQAQDVKNHEKYEEEKLKLTIKYQNDRVREVKAAYDLIVSYGTDLHMQDEEEEQKAKQTKIRIEKEKATAVVNYMRKLGKDSYESYQKLESYKQKQAEVNEKHEERILASQTIYFERRNSLEQNYHEAVRQAEETTADKIVAIQTRLLEKARQYDLAKRQSALKVHDDLLNFQQDFSDRIDAVRQRFMTVTEKKVHDYTRANERLSQAMADMETAGKARDLRGLKRIQEELSTAAGMFADLANPQQATQGLQKIKAAFLKLSELKHRVEVEKLDQRQQLEEIKAKREQTQVELKHKRILRNLAEELKNSLTSAKIKYEAVKVYDDNQHKRRLENLQSELNAELALITAAENRRRELANEQQIEFVPIELDTVIKAPINSEAAQQELAVVQAKIDKQDELIKQASESEKLNTALISDLEKLKAVLDQDYKIQLQIPEVERIEYVRQQIETIFAKLKENQQLVKEKSIWGYLQLGIMKTADAASQLKESFYEIGEVLVNDLNTGIFETIDSANSLKEGFRDMARSIVSDIQRIIVRLLVMRAIQSTMGFLGFADGGAIKKPKYGPGFADGGNIKGYSPNEKADNIPIWATAGEFMQPVRAVKHYGLAFMEAVRTLKLPKISFANGGRIPLPSMPSMRRYASGGSIQKDGISQAAPILNLDLHIDSNGNVNKKDNPSGVDPIGVYKEFLDQIGNLVTAKIVNEQRKGGLLNP